MKQNKLKRQVGGILFDSEGDYYQLDWHDYYYTVVKLVPPGSSVLEVGCGRGELSAYLRDKKNCRVKGLDISDEATKICREKGIETIRCDVEEDEIPGTYDVIILSAVLEHMMDPASVLSKLKRNLNDGGCIIIGVPNFSSILSRIQYLRGKNVKRFGETEEEMKLGIQPLGHIQFFNKPSLAYLLEKTGYKPIQWSYYKYSFSKNPKASPPRILLRWLVYKFYTIDHPLFSSFIAVKAIKT